MTRPRTHWVFAAAYDPMTRSLERAILGERRARLTSPDRALAEARGPAALRAPAQVRSMIYELEDL